MDYNRIIFNLQTAIEATRNSESASVIKIGVGGYDEDYPMRYAGSLVYDDGAFESALFGSGRIVATNNGANSEVHYFLTDHLGSTRVVTKITPTDREDLDRKDYYPFGKPWNNPDLPTSDNRYTFSGKEQQILRGQDIAYSDFGARFYDSDGVTFMQQDPLLEKYYAIGQYNYCAGNPTRLIDPTGMAMDEYYNEKGVKIYDTNQGDKTFVIRTSDEDFKNKGAITETAAHQTEAKISNGEIQGDHMKNVVEISPISTLKEAKSTIKDDGTGSDPRKSNNQREYGGNILSDNSIADVTVGPMRGDRGQLNGSVNIPLNKNTKETFHSHMSGTTVVNGILRGSSRGPSTADYKNLQGKQGYIFQMRTQEIIVYDKNGVKATLPFSVFK